MVAHRVADTPAGVYRYEPATGRLAQIRRGELTGALVRACLGQKKTGEAAAAIVGVARLSEGDGARSYRDVLLDAGATAQRIYLGAEALGLTARNLAAFYDDELDALLGLDGEREVAVHLTAVGRGRSRAAGAIARRALPRRYAPAPAQRVELRPLEHRRDRHARHARADRVHAALFAVDEHRHVHDLELLLEAALDRLQHRPAARHHVVDDRDRALRAALDPLARAVVLAVLAHDEEVAHRALHERVVRDRLRDRVGAAREPADAARVRARARELVDERRADQRHRLREARGELAVEVRRAAPPGREQEVALHVRSLDEQLREIPIPVHHAPKTSAIVAWIAIAAARGSGAERIGRPTTM